MESHEEVGNTQEEEQHAIRRVILNEKQGTKVQENRELRYCLKKSVAKERIKHWDLQKHPRKEKDKHRREKNTLGDE